MNVSLFDRLMAVASYLTMGMVGFIWFILKLLFFRRNPISRFLIRNFVQSFIISIIYAIIIYVLQTTIGLFANLPLIGGIVKSFAIFLFSPVYMTFSLFNLLALIFLVYLSVFSLLGEVPYIPYLSDAVKKNT